MAAPEVDGVSKRYVADPANTDEVQRMFAQFRKRDIALVRAIWGDYVFNPGFDNACVADMERTVAYLEASGRSQGVRRASASTGRFSTWSAARRHRTAPPLTA